MPPVTATPTERCDAQRGRAGLQYLDYLGQAVAW
jgi:hypothetical protein